jgi:hypothetical protein
MMADQHARHTNAWADDDRAAPNTGIDTSEMDDSDDDAEALDSAEIGIAATPTVLIERRSRRPSALPTPLALVFDDVDRLVARGAACATAHGVTVATWSTAAAGHIMALSTAFAQHQPRISLPVASLRARLDLADAQLLRLDRRLGLGFTNSPEILWSQTAAADCRKLLNDAVLTWLVNDVSTHAHGAAEHSDVDQLKQLARNQQAIDTNPRVSNPYEWANTLNQTALAPRSSSYADLADHIARALEGVAIFPEITPLRRVVTWLPATNEAELMTEPIVLAACEPFSYVVRVQVLTYPGRTTPVIAINFTRRVWVKELRERNGPRHLSGYALPAGTTRAVRFTMRKSRQDDGQWAYLPDDDFGPIARGYFPGQSVTTATILHDGVRLLGCQLLVGHKQGAGEKSKVKSGVPDLDKMVGFEAVARELTPLGLVPWRGLERLNSSARAVRDLNQHWRRRASTKHTDRQQHERWLAEVRESIQACYAGVHHLVIAVQPGMHTEAAGQEAARRLQDILGESVSTTIIPIAHNVHGPRATLPGRDLQAPAERAARRIAAWSSFIESVRKYQAESGRTIDGILVIADEWYANHQHDDLVNKRAARMALAVGLGVPVQYLLPPMHTATSEHAGGETQLSTAEFEDRLMIAWLDLAFKSLGLVRPGRLLNEAHKLYASPGTPSPNEYPDHVLALGVLRKNKTRFAANEPTVLPFAIELDIETGICTASVAFEDHVTKQLTWLPRQPLPQMLVALARLGPVHLTSSSGRRYHVLQERAQAFFQHCLHDVAQRSQRPLILIDADTCRSLWPWLQDKHIDPANVHLAAGYNAQAVWPHARLVRVRTQNSPKVLWDNAFVGSIRGTDEEMRYRAPSWAEAQLFSVTDTADTHIYLSFGSTLGAKRKRGVSGYRQVLGMKPGDGAAPYKAVPLLPYTGAWLTPNGVEIFVVRSAQEDPDQLARLVEWLRQCYAHFGMWTAKPAPLFFEGVLKEYIADYEYDQEEQEGEGQDDDDTAE